MLLYSVLCEVVREDVASLPLAVKWFPYANLNRYVIILCVNTDVSLVASLMLRCPILTIRVIRFNFRGRSKIT